MVVLISIDVIFKWSIASKKILVLRIFYDTTFTCFRNKKVYACENVLEKCFKICYNFGIQKDIAKTHNFFFHFVLQMSTYVKLFGGFIKHHRHIPEEC